MIGFCPQPKPSKGTSLLARRTRKAEKSAALVEAYAEVDRRDGSICRVTGWFTVPKAANPDQRREHHHLKGRRVRPEWVHKPERIITVAASAHQLITGGYLVVEGDHARKPIFFHWNLPKGMRPPFAIKSWRWSQQEE